MTIILRPNIRYVPCQLARASWTELGSIWRDFGRPGAPLGASWGASWSLLGRSKAIRDGSWSDFLGSQIFERFGIDFVREQGAQRDTFWEPKCFKIGPKRCPKLTRFLKSKNRPFETVSEPPWIDFTIFWAPSWRLKKRSGIGRRGV